MASRRGNKSTYANDEPPPDSTPASRWRKKVARGEGMLTAYERASRAFPSKVTYEDLLAVLNSLASAFGDVAFSEAAIVLKSYNFNNGALKRQVLNILEEYRGKSTDAAVEIMDQLILPASRREAARIAVEVTGIEGAQRASFEALVDEVRRGSGRQTTTPGAAWPSGDTGRRMKIAWRNRVTRMPPGAQPCDDGSFIVPDNRLWRRAIRDTFATVLAKLPAPAS